MSIVDWIYPKVCVGCGQVGRYVCEECRQKIGRVGESLRYSGLVRKMIKEIKYRGTYDMVRELVEIWIPVWRKEYAGAIVTSVPMWKYKKRVRGYNQAELMARELAKRWELEYRETLIRTRETKPMYGLARDERSDNVRGAFKIINHLTIKPLNQLIILVDDVWTTGATMRECAKVLKSAGVKEVGLITLAR